MRTKAAGLALLMSFSVFTALLPHAAASLYVDWNITTTDNGEFLTAFAHLYGAPRVEDSYGLHFCEVTLDATEGTSITGGIIEVSVGAYAQSARQAFGISERKLYTYWLNPTFNEKIAQISTPTPVTVDLRITDKSGNQLYADSKTIRMLPINYYAWVIGESDQQEFSVVLATPHADPIQKLISAAAAATPWNAIVGYQERQGYNRTDVVEAQMRAVYNVVQNLGLAYVSTTSAFTSTEVQRVKLPVQTLSDNSGNCVETTLLFDAIFEAIGFDTYVIYTATHAIVGVGTWPGSDKFLPLETSLIGSGSYDQARSLGHDSFTKAKADPSYYWLDVKHERQMGIEPTPFMDKMESGTNFYQKMAAISTKIASAKKMLDNVRAATEEKQSTPKQAQDLYQEAQTLFDDGKYQEAETHASDAMKIIAQSTPSIFPTNILPGGISLEMPQQNLLIIGIAAIVLAVTLVAVGGRKR